MSKRGRKKNKPKSRRMKEKHKYCRRRRARRRLPSEDKGPTRGITHPQRHAPPPEGKNDAIP